MHLRRIVSLAVALLICSCSNAGNNSTPLTQDVYVWQRVWNEPVLGAVSSQAANFNELVALQAEVVWKKATPVTTRVSLDFAALRVTRVKIGLALRIGAFGGPFESANEQGRYLVDLARSLVAEAESNRLAVAELQLDFDCAESKLDGYRVWVQAIREAIKPVPLTLTSLPSWLNRPAFRSLVQAADGFVLQVHSLERPANPDAPFTLCDPRAATLAVERAGKLGKPFRVALPTYGYLLAFDPGGKFKGLSAEGPLREWPASYQLREVRSDPKEISTLVRTWQQDHPSNMRGLIWYRLPVPGDRLNWSRPALSSVMAGREPQARVRAEFRRPESGLTEIDLINAGDGDYQGPARIVVRWRGAHLLASDGWAGFEQTESGNEALRFEHPKTALAAGQRRPIGWLRLDHDCEVSLECNP